MICLQSSLESSNYINWGPMCSEKLVETCIWVKVRRKPMYALNFALRAIALTPQLWAVRKYTIRLSKKKPLIEPRARFITKGIYCYYISWSRSISSPGIKPRSKNYVERSTRRMFEDLKGTYSTSPSSSFTILFNSSIFLLLQPAADSSNVQDPRWVFVQCTSVSFN